MKSRTEVPSSRKTHQQWRRLVADWRRSGATAAAFAAEHSVVEGTLRWWAWKLSKEVASVSLVPVRVAPSTSRGVAESPDVWTLRTARGELVVRGPDADARANILAAIFGAPS